MGRGISRSICHCLDGDPTAGTLGRAVHCQPVHICESAGEERVDFDDTPEEAAFRAEARAWLDANAKPKVDAEQRINVMGATATTPRRSPRPSAGRPRWPTRAGRPSTGRPPTAGATPAAARVHGAVRGAGPLRRARHALRHRRRHDRADDHRPRHRRARRSATSSRCDGARRSGASSGASPTPAPTSPSLRHPGRAGRRRVRAQRPEGLDQRRPLLRLRPRHLPHRPDACRSTRASPASSSTCARRASRSGPCARSPARPTSTRCSSTTCACPAANLVGDLHDGWRVARTTLMNERHATGSLGLALAAASSALRRRRAQRRRAGRSTTRWCARSWPGCYTLGRLFDLTNARVRTAHGHAAASPASRARS